MSGDIAVPIAAHSAMGEDNQPEPLTERVLSRLPGPRLLWIIVWMLVPWIHALVTLMLQASGYFKPREDVAAQLLNRVGFSLAIFCPFGGLPRLPAASNP